MRVVLFAPDPPNRRNVEFLLCIDDVHHAVMNVTRSFAGSLIKRVVRRA
jgi:hypothetical protein